MIVVDDEAVDRVYKSALTKIGLDHPIGQLSLPFLPQQVPSNNAPYIELLIPLDIVRDGYVTPIVVNANEILFLPIRRFFVKDITPLHHFAGTNCQLNNHKVNHLHNLQTITMGVI